MKMVEHPEITAHQVCENLLLQVKNSQLNFHLSETPYSINLSLRKRFLKESTRSKALDLSLAIPDAALYKENETLKTLLEEKETEIEAFKGTINIIENKVEHAEAEVLTHFKELQNLKKKFEKEKEENALLKEVIKNHSEEMSKSHIEIKSMTKAQKLKEKEIHNLENKTLNLQEVNKKLKEENSNLKREKVTSDKEVKRVEKRIAKLESDTKQNITAAPKLSKTSVSTNTEFIKIMPSPNMMAITPCSTNLSKSISNFSTAVCPVTQDSPKGFDKGLDDNSNETDENLSHIPSVPTNNQFHVLNQSWLEENPISPGTTRHMDTTCSLNTTARQLLTNSSLDTIPTTTSLLVSSSLDNTCSVVDRALALALAKNDEMRDALMKKIDDMIKTSEN